MDQSTPLVKTDHAITTRDVLDGEYRNNGWAERLSQCREIPMNRDRDFNQSARGYKSQRLVKYKEAGITVAFMTHYELHDGSTKTVIHMLLVDGIKLCAP